jgi:periplasmic divalent cation tolerance protein
MKGIKFFYITCPKKKEAFKIAAFLVKKKLVACANIIQNVDSIFTWKGKVTKAKEILIVGKTMNKNVQKIIKSVKKLHSYEVPCVIFFDIKGGNTDFLKWIINPFNSLFILFISGRIVNTLSLSRFTSWIFFWGDFKKQPDFVPNPFGTSINHALAFFYLSIVGLISYMRESNFKQTIIFY